MSYQAPPNPERTLAQQVSELELRVAYHERLNQDLSDQVYTLHREVEALRAQLHVLIKQQQQNRGQLNAGPADETPPHY